MMADDDTRSEVEGAGSSSGKGTFHDLKQRFKLILDSNYWELKGAPKLRPEHKQKWKEMSSTLHPASNVKDRARVLAFILQRCTPLLSVLREPQPEELLRRLITAWHGTENKDYRMDILGHVRFIVQHVCMDDHSDYTPLHRQCFQYYGECMIVLNIFSAVSECMLADAPGFRNKFQRCMHETGICFLRCWSMIRSQDVSMELSPALHEDYRALLEAAGANPDAARLFDIAIDAQRILTQYIGRLATDLLTGMMKNDKLKVNKVDAGPMLDECKAVMKGTVGGGALADKLGRVLEVVQDRYRTANQGAGKKVNVDAFLKAGPATLPQDMECIAAECLDPERKKLFNRQWLSDLQFCSQLDQRQFGNAASYLVFSAMPGIYATHRLLDWKKYLGSDAEAGGGGRPAGLIEVLNKSLQD